MRNIMKFFGQYRAVHTSENGQSSMESGGLATPTTETTCEKFPKSLKANRSINKGFSIVDVFFKKRKAGRGPRWPKGIFLLKASGLLAIISAIIMYILQPYDAIFKWKLIFAEGGEIFNLWQSPPVELYVKIYLYNITNAEKFMTGEEKMKVEEVGPYVYREKLVHDDIEFNANGTVSAVPKHPLIWNEELSMGHKEDDVFMLPNIALLSIAQVASEKSYFLRLPINIVIRQTNSQPIVRMTAKEFMFGYESPLTTLGNKFLPDWIYFEKVGLIDRMYDFEGDYETVYTGENDHSTSGLLETYRGSSQLKQWSEPHCSNINMASDGTKFKSYIGNNETLLFFRKSMCRAQRMVRVGDESTVGSLSAYKYMFENNAMDNGFVDEKNKCFCRNNKCLPSGLLDVADCYYGFPIALSYPHFLDSDPKLLEDVEGSRPNRTDHETYFMIQPLSGLPLKLSVKMQINMAMRDVSNMAHVEQFSNIVVPMLWFEITMPDLPDSLKSRFFLYLNVLPVLDSFGQIGLFATGVILLVVAIVRASMSFSQTIQPSHKISNQRRYSSIGRDNGDYGGGGDDNLSYEMTEKCIRNSGGHMYDVDLGDEKEYMLEQERALSEDDENDSDSKTLSYQEVESSSSSSGPNLVNENNSFQMNHRNASSAKLIDNCHLGDTSSCLDDIGNDNFHVLRIDEDDLMRSSLHGSVDSLSNILDQVDVV